MPKKGLDASSPSLLCLQRALRLRRRRRGYIRAPITSALPPELPNGSRKRCLRAWDARRCMADAVLFEFLHTEMVAELWARDPDPSSGVSGTP